MKRLLTGLVLLLGAVVPPLSAADAGTFRPEADQADILRREAEQTDDPESYLAVARRFFEGGAYLEALHIYDALLKNPNFLPLPPKADADATTAGDGPESQDTEKSYQERRVARQADREACFYFRARCRLELIGEGEDIDPAPVIDELESLAKNEHRFVRPRYDKEALFWIGRAHLRAGDPKAAAEAFQKLGEMSLPPELDADAAYYSSRALIQMANRVLENDKSSAESRQQRDAQLARAIALLARVARDYPENRHWREIELTLMRLQIAVGKYKEAEALAEAYLKRETQATPLRAEGLLIRAQCAYYLGELEDAIRLYERILTEEHPRSTTEVDALFGLGWAYTRLTRTAGADQRRSYLTHAQAVFRRAVQEMPPGDSRNLIARLELSDALIGLGEYNEALMQLERLADEKEYRGRVRYLMGIAARGQGEHERAAEQFERVIRIAGGDPRAPFILEAHKGLAELEYALGAYASSSLHYRRMQRLALMHRDAAARAEAELGVAKALMAMGEANKRQRDIAAKRYADALVRLLALPAGTEPRALASLAEETAFTLQTYALWQQAGPANYDRALAILNLLRQRHGDRLRMDEIDYERARALFGKAHLQHQRFLDSNEAGGDALRLTRRLYDNAAAMAQQASNANPRGVFAPEINLLLGRIFFEQGRLVFAVAERLREQAEPTDAPGAFEEEGRRFFEKSIPSFQLAGRTATLGSPVWAKSQERLALAYFELEDYERALARFEELIINPDTDQESRRYAIRYAARALARLGRREQAVKRLLPYVEVDLGAAVQAGDLLLSLNRPREAYRTYLAGLRDAGGGEATAEAFYRTHSLGLSRAEEVAPPGQAESVRKRSEKGLLDLATRFPDSPWSRRALLALGEYHLKRGETEAALRVVDEGLRSLGDDPHTAQVLRLLMGRIHLRDGRSDEALAAFQQAERIRSDTARGRALRAAAIREQGNALLAKGQVDLALGRFSYVFAFFPNIAREADLARVAAAKIHAAQGRLDQARAILAKGLDRQLMEEAVREIERLPAASSTVVPGLAP